MKHVLIIDDNQTDRFLTRAFLERMGYVVHEVFDGNMVEKALDLFPPDLIVLDLVMPNINGFDTLELIQNTDPDIPVIVLSCVGDEFKEKILALNAKACFQKPYDAHEFSETVIKLLG